MNDVIKEPIFLRSAHNYDMHQASLNSSVICTEEEDRAKQSFKEECDINTIMEKFRVNGIPPIAPLPNGYGDFTGISDYQSAMNVIVAANEAFEEMPSKIRNRFNNDPREFVDFCTDENNKEELIKLGLLKKIEAAPQPPAPDVPPEPPAEDIPVV